MHYELPPDSRWNKAIERSPQPRRSRTGPCRILGLGAYVPERVLPNAELAAAFDVAEDWIFSRTGIKERRILAPDQITSDLGLHAATAALADSKTAPKDITHILLGSCSPDGLVPNTACTLERKLGLSGIIALDFNVACSGFLYGLYLSRAILCLEPEAKVLLVAAEAMSRICDWRDRDVSVIFGDGAGAAVLGSGPGPGLLVEDTLLASDGRPGELLTANGGGSRAAYTPDDQVGSAYFLHMQGREVFKHAVQDMTDACRRLLNRHRLGPEDIDLFVPHQANRRIIEAVGQRLAIPPERVLINIERFGNTSAATIPIALAEARANGTIKPGMHILSAAFGAGFTWGAALLRS